MSRLRDAFSKLVRAFEKYSIRRCIVELDPKILETSFEGIVVLGSGKCRRDSLRLETRKHFVEASEEIWRKGH